MESRGIAADLLTQMRERPYWTTAALVGAGWILGRSLPLRALLAVAGIGARAAVAAAIETAFRERVNGTSANDERSI